MAIVKTNVPASWPTAKEPVTTTMELTTAGTPTASGFSDILEVGRFTSVTLFFQDTNIVSTSGVLTLLSAPDPDATFGGIWASSATANAQYKFTLEEGDIPCCIPLNRLITSGVGLTSTLDCGMIPWLQLSWKGTSQPEGTTVIKVVLTM